MSLPCYSEYKDSGVAWLGEVPGHWDLKPLWTLFRRTKRTGYVEEELLSVYRDYGVIPKTSRDDNNNKPSDDLEPYQLVMPGDLAINKMKAWQGSVAISEYRGIVSPAYFVYEATHNETPRYLHYLMRSPRYITGYLSLSKGIRVSQWDLEPQYHSRMPIVLPPKSEQQTIAAFLDRETGKIDALIAEQRRLVELLAEKRQAVISQAVTKGLNPSRHSRAGGNPANQTDPSIGQNDCPAAQESSSQLDSRLRGNDDGVPMKDSGIEWLGEVPEHWRIAKLKHLAQFSGGGTPSRENLSYWNGDIPWVSPKDMKREFIDSAEESITSEGLKNSTTNLLSSEHVLIVARSGILQHTIPVAINVVPVALNQDMKALRFNDRECFNKFFLRWVQGLNDLLLLEWAKQGATVESIEHAYLAETIIPLPPIAEQQAIVNFLDTQTAQFDTLTAEANRAIALLQERRSALISAAVTGKIDVRRHSRVGGNPVDEIILA